MCLVQYVQRGVRVEQVEHVGRNESIEPTVGTGKGESARDTLDFDPITPARQAFGSEPDHRVADVDASITGLPRQVIGQEPARQFTGATPELEYRASVGEIGVGDHVVDGRALVEALPVLDSPDAVVHASSLFRRQCSSAPASRHIRSFYGRTLGFDEIPPAGRQPSGVGCLAFCLFRSWSAGRIGTVEFYDEDQETRPGPRILVWILLISAVFALSGFIPLILAGRAHPLENLYRNCIEGESGIRPDDSLEIVTDDGIPIAVTFGDIESVSGNAQQTCFDLIVRVATYR